MMAKGILRRIAIASLGLLIFAFIGAEVSARALGAGDFPITDVSDTVGYIPAASQSGAFLNRNRWAYNERHMGVARPFRPTPEGILLIGDSIVNGGNPTDQPDRLGPQIEARTGCPVWPVSAGSWALLNELNEIRTNPDFLKLGTIVFVLNSGDFGKASVWASDYTHPRHHPLLVSLYALRRLYWPVNDNVPSKITATSQTDWHRAVARFLSSYHGKTLFVLYPARAQEAAGKAAFPLEIRQVSRADTQHASSLWIVGDPRWNVSLYRDDIHPGPAGNRVLATIVAEKLSQCDKNI